MLKEYSNSLTAKYSVAVDKCDGVLVWEIDSSIAAAVVVVVVVVELDEYY